MMNLDNALTGAIRSHVRNLPTIERLAFKKAAHAFIESIDEGVDLQPMKYESFAQQMRDQLAALEIDGTAHKVDTGEKPFTWCRPYIHRAAGKLEIKIETRVLDGSLHVKRIK